MEGRIYKRRGVGVVASSASWDEEWHPSLSMRALCTSWRKETGVPSGGHRHLKRGVAATADEIGPPVISRGGIGKVSSTHTHTHP